VAVRPVPAAQPRLLNRSVALCGNPNPLITTGEIGTVVCVPLTSNLKWALAPGNVHLPARLTGLPKDSVANVSLIVSVDRELLTRRVGKLSRSNLELALSGIDTILGR
jgi:mRNA interferase MazF